MTALQPYSEYKDSGITWLEQIPADWSESRLGYSTRVRARLGWKGLKAEEYVDEGIAFLSTPNIKGREIDFANANFITSERYDESPEIKLEIDDVLLAKDGSTLGTVNVVRVLPRPATVNSSVAILSPGKRCSGQYLNYLIQSELIQNRIELLKDGMGVPHLFQDDIRRIAIPLPPMEVQSQIVKYLDYETAEIDNLIGKQERLNELLYEQRQAVITHAVTKGLDPATPSKPSGIPWAGDIPATWSIQRTSWLFGTIASGTTPPSDKPEYYDGETNWVTTGELREKPIRDTSKKVTSIALAEFPTLRLYPAGTLLMAMYGATIGRLGILAEPATTNQACCAFAHPVRATSKFVFYSMMAAKEHLLVMASGGGQPNINQEKIRALRLPLPEIHEQIRIVDWLETRLSKIDALTDRSRRMIRLLKERRSALISAAVTGRIDVRVEAAKM